MGILSSNKSARFQKIFESVGLDKALDRSISKAGKNLDDAETLLTDGGLEKRFAKETEGLDSTKAEEILNSKRKEIADKLNWKEEGGHYGKSAADYLGISQKQIDDAGEAGEDIFAKTIANKRASLAKGGFGGLSESSGALDTGLSVANQYYLGGTKGENARHIAGTYAAGALGARLLSGGTPVTNSNGERDIVGLPFV